MIERQKGQILVECDSCGQVLEGGSDEWDEVWPQAKGDGWRARKIEEVWTHICPDCRRLGND